MEESRRIGMVAVHFVAMELAKLGVATYVTGDHALATDLLAYTDEGRVLSIQVKSRRWDGTKDFPYTVAGWTRDDVPATYREGTERITRKIAPSDTKVYVFVLFDDALNVLKVWSVPSKIVLREVLANRDEWIGGPYQSRSKLRPRRDGKGPVLDAGPQQFYPEYEEEGFGAIIKTLQTPHPRQD